VGRAPGTFQRVAVEHQGTPERRELLDPDFHSSLRLLSHPLFVMFLSSPGIAAADQVGPITRHEHERAASPTA
jgi:hypothetical protein